MDKSVSISIAEIETIEISDASIELKVIIDFSCSVLGTRIVDS